MKKLIVAIIITVIVPYWCQAQINPSDSTAQIITYWNKGDSYSYSINFDKYKIKSADTVSSEFTTYDVDVSVIDSTEHSYLVRWYYTNYQSSTDNILSKKMAALAENIAVDVKIDEYGTVLGVENWKEVKKYIQQALNKLKAEYKNSDGMEQIVKQVMQLYSTKEAIEASAIQDVQQLHYFHGAVYKFNEELTGEIETPNLYEPEKPFTTAISVMLEDIDFENYQYTVRAIQEVDQEQLTNTTYAFLQKMMGTMNKELPPRSEFPVIRNTTETVSLIHDSGWVIESVQWKEVEAEGVITMEMRTVMMN